MEEKKEIRLEKNKVTLARERWWKHGSSSGLLWLSELFGLLVPYKNSGLVAKPLVDLWKHRLSPYVVVRTVHESRSWELVVTLDGFSFLLINFHWSVVALQCCVNFHCTANNESAMYTYLCPLLFGFPSCLGHQGTWSQVPCAIP